MTINNENIVGLVLKNKPYKDNDALVWIYTRDYGKLTLVCRGVKKIKSKNAPAVQTITLSEFNFHVRVGLCNLIKGSVINYFRHIKEDLELEIYASYFCEFVDKFTEENEPNDVIFDNTLKALSLIDSGYPCKLVYLLYNAFILSMTGSSLEVDCCSHCNRHDLIVGISISGGGFVCQECISSHDLKLSVDVLKGFRYINKCDFDNIDKLHLDETVINELSKVMEVFVDEYTGIVFQSRKFIRQFND